jgi:hypothetical protein
MDLRLSALTYSISEMETLIRIAIEVGAPIGFIWFGKKALFGAEDERERTFSEKHLTPRQRKFVFSSRYLLFTKIGGGLALLIGLCLGSYEIYLMVR